MSIVSEMRALIERLKQQGWETNTIRRQFEAELLRDELRNARGNQCRAADNLGIHRNTFSHHLKEHGIVPSAYKSWRNEPRGR